MYHIKIPRMVLQVLLVARWAVPSDRLHRTESTDEFDDCIDYDPRDPGTQVLAFLFCSPFHIFCSSSSSSSSSTLSYIILPLPHTVWVSCLMSWAIVTQQSWSRVGFSNQKTWGIVTNHAQWWYIMMTSCSIRIPLWYIYIYDMIWYMSYENTIIYDIILLFMI